MAVTSLGYQLNKQPIAQSFFISASTGIYCTKVDLYFSKKDASLPVQIQIRPMVNGFPSSSKIIPGTIKMLPAGSVNVDTSGPALTATSFQFDEPVFLKGQEDYALVITADSKDYEIYIAEINEFQFGSTERRANKQPDLGSLFYSQNGVTWTPSQNQDLAFAIHQAKFKYKAATAILHNATLPNKKLINNPLTLVSGDATVKVRHIGHGLNVNDVINISGVGAPIPFEFDSSVNGRRTITKVDWTGYTFEADSNADSDAIAGGANMIASKNIPFSLIYPSTQMLTPRNTFVAGAIKATTGKSFAGGETAYQKQQEFQTIKFNENNQALEPYIIAFDSAEANELTPSSETKSFDMRILMNTEDSDISPMIDLQRTSISLIDNIVDKQDPAATNGFNVPLNYVDETSPTDGSAAAKHLTKIVTLDDDAVGLKVLITANRPNDTDFQVYYRTGTSDEVITDKSFVLQSPETAMPADEEIAVFREYKYLIGGQNGVLPAFTKFQIKIVFRSTNSAKVPRIRDLRIIALSV